MIGHNETSETFSLFPDERITFYLTVFTFSFCILFFVLLLNLPVGRKDFIS